MSFAARAKEQAFLEGAKSFVPGEPGQHRRSGDLTNALCGLLDMTPEGQGHFFSKVRYD